MTASLTPTVYVLRLHTTGGMGAPYEGSATVVDRGDATAEILGLTMARPFTARDRAAIRAALWAAGYRWAVWERRAGDDVRAVRRPV